MGIFDFLSGDNKRTIDKLNNEIISLRKIKEEDDDKIALLTKENISLTRTNESLITKNESLSKEKDSLESESRNLRRYKCILDLEYEKDKILSDIEKEKESFKNRVEEYDEIISSKKSEIDRLNKEICNKKSQIVELDDTILLQEFGLYEPIFDFANSDIYKSKLHDVREEQKELIRKERAAFCNKEWSVDGSISKGRIFIKRNIKQIIRSFNDECDVLVNKVKFNNVEAYIHKMVKSYDDLNRLNEPNCISISQSYLNLKLQELRLSYEYALKKQREKAQQRAIREQMREEAKLMEEIEQRRKEVLKELSHYNKQIVRVEELLSKAPEDEKDYLNQKKEYIEDRLSELDREIKEMDYREANKKAGYVYVISNIGAFGEGVYKIGMTRRLEPMDRIDELSNASVPFKFDVHAMIFSDDAPKLESSLHKAFEERKINMVNNRKEFFRVGLDEIEEVVKRNYEKAVEFCKIPSAEQYRETIKILNSISREQ